MALADVDIAKADLHLNEINLAKATIRSPIDGIVLQRNVEPGQFVTTSVRAPILFLIADLRHIEVRVDVSEVDIGKINIGQKVSASVSAYPERKFSAEVHDIRLGSEIGREVAAVYKVILRIDNSEQMIRPGMTARAEIVVRQINDALLVPNAALNFPPLTPVKEWLDLCSVCGQVSLHHTARPSRMKIHTKEFGFCATVHPFRLR